MRSILELLHKANRLARELRGATGPAEQEPAAPVLLLPAPRAELLCKGAKTLVIDASPSLPVQKVLQVADVERLRGVVVLGKARPMSLAEFRRRRAEHQIEDEVRKSTWPKSRKLYAYEVENVEALEVPKAWRPPVDAGLPREELSEETVKAFDARGAEALQCAAAAALEFQRSSQQLLEQAKRLAPEQSEWLVAAAEIAGPLAKSLGALSEHLGVQIVAGRPVPAFPAAELLGTSLQEISSLVPETTRSGALARLMQKSLPAFLEREGKFGQEGGELPSPENRPEYYFRGLSPELVKNMPDQALLEMYALGKKLLEEVFVDGKTVAGQGLTKEDVESGLVLIIAEAKARGLEGKLGELPDLAPLYKAETSDDLDTVLPRIYAELMLEPPFVPLPGLAIQRREDTRAIVEMRHTGLPLIEAEPVNLRKADAKEQTHRSVLQAHIRGQSLHGDFRVQSGNVSVGYTLAIQIAGQVPKFESLEQAKQFVASFSPDGSSWNKSLRAPSHVYAGLKDSEPAAWLGINAEEFAPGSVGATRNETAYMVALARPLVTLGELSGHYHEFFLEKDPKFSGLLALRMLAGGGAPNDVETDAGRKAPQGATFWVAMLAKDLVPYVVKPRAVETGRVPPQGVSQLPPALRAAVPKELQYWLASDEKERREIRDALVKERFFTEQNVRLVDNEFRRVIVKYYLADPSVQTPRERDIHTIIPCPTTAPEDARKSEGGQEKTSEPVEEPAVEPIQELAGQKTTTTFVLLHQQWNGASRQVHHLAIKGANGADDYQFVDDLSSGSAVAIKQHVVDEAADKLMSLEGEIAPDARLGDLVLDPTKATASVIRRVVQGSVELEHAPEGGCILRFAADGQPDWMAGEFSLQPKASGDDLWLLSRRETPVAPTTPTAKRRHFEIMKSDLEERFVFGVVLIPNEYDSQGDIYDVEAVRKAAYYYMEEIQNDSDLPALGLMHQSPIARRSIRVLESYLAPVDMYIENQSVKKGTWLLAAHVLDDELWKAIKDGRLTGWSMEGSAIARELN